MSWMNQVFRSKLPQSRRMAKLAGKSSGSVRAKRQKVQNDSPVKDIEDLAGFSESQIADVRHHFNWK